MISLRKYLNAPSSFDETVRRVLSLLVQAIELHTFKGNDDDYRLFRSSLNAALKEFGPDSSPEQLLIMSGELSNAMREYGDRTTRFVRTQNAEYQRMVHMLTEAVTSSTQGSHSALGRLRTLESQLERTAKVEDVRALRVELGQCLRTLRESIREQTEEAERAEKLRAATATQCRPPIPQGDTPADTASTPGSELSSGNPDDDIDHLTPAVVQTALVEGAPDGHRYVLVFGVDRFHAYQTRFGGDLAERILWCLKRDIQHRLAGDDRLYRWQGSTFVGLLARPSRLSEVTSELARTVGSKFEEHVEFGSRSIMLTVSLNWIVFPLTGSDAEILQKIADFTARFSTPSSTAASPRTG